MWRRNGWLSEEAVKAMHQKHWGWIYATLIGAAILCHTTVAQAVAQAAPHAQTGQAPLIVDNQSSQTICGVFVATAFDATWGENRLVGWVIAPAQDASFTLTSGAYDVLLVACDAAILLDRRGLAVEQAYTLAFTERDAALAQCLALADQGASLKQLGELREAETVLLEAVDCYRAEQDRAGEGATRNRLGQVYRGMGRYVDALEHYQSALAIRRALGDRAGEASSLHDSALVYGQQGRYADALEHYQAALAIWRASGNRASEGAALEGIGGLEFVQGRYPEALEYFTAAFEIARETGNRAREGTALTMLGRLAHAQGRYAEALASYEVALAIARDLEDHAEEALLLNNIGGVHSEQGRYAEALAHYEDALSLRHAVGDRTGESLTLNNMGNVASEQGRYTEALAYFDAALALARASGNRRNEGMILNNTGLVLSEQGRYAEALAHYEAALAIRRAVADRAGEGTTLGNIGELLRKQARYAEALPYYEATLAVWRALDDRSREGITLNNLGSLYSHQGREAEALEKYTAALAISQEVGDRSGVAVGLNNIGALYDKQGRHAEALEHFAAALAINQELGERSSEATTLYNIGWVYRSREQLDEALTHFTTALEIARQIGFRALEGAALGGIGEVYEQQTRAADALSHYRQALDIYEEMRAVAGSESARASFIAKYDSYYDRTLTLHLQQDQLADAFLLSERGRARTFLDSLATGQVELADNAATDLLSAEQEAFAVRQSVQDALAKAKALDPPDPQLVADLQAQLSVAELVYAQTLAGIRARRDQLIALVPGRNNSVLGVKQVQALLDSQTTLISYWMLGNRTVVFVVTAADFNVIELPEATTSAISTTVQSLHQWVNKENAHPRPLRNLHRWLVAPLAETLQTSHVVVVPHQELHYVPFAALTDGQRYFGEEHVLTLLPSASALHYLANNARQSRQRTESEAPPTALIFGNPATDLPGLPALPFAETEARIVADLLATTVYTGANASELMLRTAVSGTAILHLAAHGSYNSTDPLASLIALAPGGGDDGRLEVRDIFGLPLMGSSLVMLSACESNLGQLSRGDEVVGMTRAFFFAGAPTVVSSLWSVSDDATAALMTAFYRYWLNDDMSKAEALQAAQADVRQNPRWASPYYWAAFALNGHPGQMGANH